MQKRYIIIGVILLFFLVIGFICYSKDNIRFKFSYELVNKVELAKNKKIKINIPIDNRVKYIKNGTELIDLFKNGTGIIYMGYETCPWCRNAVPVLIDSVISNNLDTIYYLNIHDVDISSVKDELYKILDEYLKVTDNSEKVLAVPDVYAIKNGKIVAHHRGCVEGYKNPYKKMNNEQIDELKDIYNKMIKEIK